MEIKYLTKTVLFFLMVSFLGLQAQSKEDLKREVDKLKNELQEFKKQTKEVVKEKKQDLSPNVNAELEKKYQSILADNNRVFFDEIFETKYKKNPQYLLTTTLGKDDDTSKFKNYNVVLANIINDSSKSGEDKKLAIAATVFNKQYISFFNLREQYKDFYTKKYDSATAVKYAADLSALNLTDYDGLNKQKSEMLSSIHEYKLKSCELKDKLNKLKVFAKADNAVLASQYAQIKKGYNIPYLQKIITDMSKDLSSYKEDSLPGCGLNVKKESQGKEAGTEKKEVKKEDGLNGTTQTKESK